MTNDKGQNSPLVSVIVPNYNHSLYLTDRLTSILDQKYQNIEVVLLDDCSTDESVAILRQYENREKVKCLKINRSNSGSPFAQWKKGIDLAAGKYVWIAESDDFSTIDFLSCMVPKLEQDQAIGFAYCQSAEIDRQGVLYDNHNQNQTNNEDIILKKEGIFEGKEFVRSYLVNENIIRNVSAVLFRKESLTIIPWDYICTYKYAGDWIVYIMILMQSKIGFVNRKLNHFRTHAESTRFKKGIDGWKCYFSEIFLVLNFLSENKICNCSQKMIECSQILERYVRFSARLKKCLKTASYNEVVIYGAGDVGQFACDLMSSLFPDIRILGFIDQKASYNQVLKINGLDVMTLEMYRERFSSVPICIGSIAYATEIKELLIKNGLSKNILSI